MIKPAKMQTISTWRHGEKKSPTSWTMPDDVWMYREWSVMLVRRAAEIVPQFFIAAFIADNSTPSPRKQSPQKN